MPRSQPIPTPIAAALDAANAHDLDRFLSCFTSDGVVDDWGRTFRGAEAIAGWSDAEFIGVGVTLRVVGVTGSDDRTTVEVEVGGDGYNGPGHFTFELDGQRVRRMEIRA
jgi:hypothetical protein